MQVLKKNIYEYEFLSCLNLSVGFQRLHEILGVSGIQLQCRRVFRRYWQQLHSIEAAMRPLTNKRQFHYLHNLRVLTGRVYQFHVL